MKFIGKRIYTANDKTVQYTKDSSIYKWGEGL